MHSLAEAVDRLQSPYATETFSVLTGEPLLVVDVSRDAEAISVAALRQASEALARLACPSVAIRAGSPGANARELLPRFDVVAQDDAELAAVVGATRKTPLACLALVQLLRQSERLDLHEGLVAESLVYSTLQSGPEFAAWRASRQEPRSRRARSDPAVLVDRSADRFEIVLNRAERHNAFSTELRDGLVEALQVVVSDPSIREVVWTGAGPSFCSGGDLDEFGTFPDPATAHAIRSTRHAGRLLIECADRVSVRVHGACVGAGIELPAFAHHVVAASDAFFLLPEVNFGLVPGAGGTASIPRRIGRQRTAYLAIAGVRIDAPTALAWGLVDELA